MIFLIHYAMIACALAAAICTSVALALWLLANWYILLTPDYEVTFNKDIPLVVALAGILWTMGAIALKAVEHGMARW
jgi:hypothetical protein